MNKRLKSDANGTTCQQPVPPDAPSPDDSSDDDSSHESLPRFEYYLNIRSTIDDAPDRKSEFSAPYAPLRRDHLAMHLKSLCRTMNKEQLQKFRALPLKRRFEFFLSEEPSAQDPEATTAAYWLDPVPSDAAPAVPEALPVPSAAVLPVAPANKKP